MPSHQSRLFWLCIFAVCVLLCHACIKPPKDFDPRYADNVYSGCRVKKTVVQPQYGGPLTRLFTYNSNNDPVSVNAGGGTGNSNPAFKYDNKHRLIEFAGLYLNGGYEYLHHYKYEKDLIVIDTQSVFGIFGGPPPPIQNFVYHYLRYDKFERIIQDSLVNARTNTTSSVTNYDYDQKGNLIYYRYDDEGQLIDKHVLYDDKLSPRRLNKIWMFIDRNYSVNNPVVASAYNSYGLPLKMQQGDYLFNSPYGGPTEITYDCK